MNQLNEEKAETITHEGRIICLIIRVQPLAKKTHFYTQQEFNLQVGEIVYPADSEIPRHYHHSVSRSIEGTSEVLVVQRGSMIVDLYTDKQSFLCSREMNQGDVIVLVSGGHGFRILQDTVLLEVKQGTYSGIQEKERF